MVYTHFIFIKHIQRNVIAYTYSPRAVCSRAFLDTERESPSSKIKEKSQLTDGEPTT